MEEMSENVEVNQGDEREKKPFIINVKFDSHDTAVGRDEELTEIDDEIERQWTIPDNHYWSNSATTFVKEKKPGMLILNNLAPHSSIGTVSYYLPGDPSEIREVYAQGTENSPIVLATGLSLDAVPHGAIRDALEDVHEDNSYNWDDPENQDLANKVKELFIEKSRQTVYRTAVRMAILTYAPWLMPANLVTRANVPFREFIGRRSLPTDKVATFVADKVPLEVSPEVVSFIHRWSEFPFVGMGTGDLEFQRALMCIKARDVYENIGSEHIPGDVLALLPNYEKPVKYIFNNEAEQKEIAQEGMRKFFSFFSDLAEASHQLITPELRGQVIDVASAYLGSVEARRIDPMRENETVNLTERNMPVIHAEVSPTISRMMNEIADEIWPQDDICYFPRKVQYGRSLFKRLRH